MKRIASIGDLYIYDAFLAYIPQVMESGSAAIIVIDVDGEFNCP